MRDDFHRHATRRSKLGLTQQQFASLLGFSFVSVNRWENGHIRPKGLSAVVLSLLDTALRRHPAERVERTLREAHGDPVMLVIKLVRLGDAK